ncbi:MAG TPA: hypothetical protein VN256_16830 [Pyrinomonadaceae bacterium]|nr:hypothetical protein [Pyrinomonadaceae bacterium]
MASFSIPKQIIAGFTLIATMPEEVFNEFVSALDNIPPKILQHRVVDISTIKLTTLSPEDTKALNDALAPLFRSMRGGDVEPAQYAKDIGDSIREDIPDEAAWAQSKEQLAQFKERLTRLLNAPSLQLIAKAHDVLLEHAQTFSSARIVSDIRPVFRDSVDDQPVAAVIVHMLNLTYFQAGERQEFVVALDTKDIQDLLDTCERAKKKTERLKAVIGSSDMTYIEVE